MHMNIMEKKRKSLMAKNKKSAFHIKNGYKRFKSSNGYKFWAKDIKDAEEYCIMMNWVLSRKNS